MEYIQPGAQENVKVLVPRELVPELDVDQDYEFVAVQGAEQHLIITIHGIQTMGQWMDDFESQNPARSLIKVEKIPLDSWVDIYTFLFGSQKKIIDGAKRDLIHLLDTHSTKKISAICHSFGTKVFCEAVSQITAERKIRFHHVYFIGGVATIDDISSRLLKKGSFRRPCRDSLFPKMIFGR